MKFVKRVVGMSVLFATTICPVAAFAGNVGGATITGVTTVGNYGPFFVFVSQNDTNIGCNASNLNEYAIDPTTAGGRAQIAQVLAAQASGRVISVIGSGSCSLGFGNVEGASFIGS